MAIAAWPSIVPVESLGGSASATFQPPIGSETEGGPALMRPRPGPRVTEISWVSKPLTSQQWQALEQFFRLDLRDGSLPFMMPVLRPDSGYVSRVCQIKGGAFSTDLTIRPWVRVSFTLIVYNW